LRLPRDLAGTDLASMLARYGYQQIRETGSHIRLVSSAKGHEHHITIPAHKSLKPGTLSSILRDVAAYLEMERSALADDLFGS
jgi:predicted RNA binding protein YcfA (HicA-like mRNA interferase family)